MFLIGLAVFTAASAVCGLAVNQQMLVIARFVQGAGGALTSAVVLGMIVTMFPEPREQAKAIGVFAFVASAGGAVGLLAGGAITQADQLALDLLRERPGGRGSRSRGACVSLLPTRASGSHTVPTSSVRRS